MVISAGVPRKPGMTRADLFGVNAGIVHTLVIPWAPPRLAPSPFLRTSQHPCRHPRHRTRVGGSVSTENDLLIQE